MKKKDALNKKHHLEYFRERGKETLIDLQREIGRRQHKELATAINNASQDSARNVLSSIRSTAIAEKWTPVEKVSAILAANYASYVAMLELRNEVWPYEYMVFSRRLGELWESFVRAVFDHAPSGLTYFVPPLFADVRKGLKKEITEYIAQLPISNEQSFLNTTKKSGRLLIQERSALSLIYILSLTASAQTLISRVALDQMKRGIRTDC